jgi:hypothetical protein
VQFRVSAEVERQLENLETSDPLRFALVIDDLVMLELSGPADAAIHSMFAGWTYLTGPTGRVSYWLTPDDNDVWWVESIDVT